MHLGTYRKENKMTKGEFAQLINVVRNGGEFIDAEQATNDLADDLGFVELLCKHVAPEYLASLENDPDGKLW